VRDDEKEKGCRAEEDWPEAGVVITSSNACRRSCGCGKGRGGRCCDSESKRWCRVGGGGVMQESQGEPWSGKKYSPVENQSSEHWGSTHPQNLNRKLIQGAGEGVKGRIDDGWESFSSI